MAGKKLQIDWEFLSEDDHEAPWPPFAQDASAEGAACKGTGRGATSRIGRLRRAAILGLALAILLATGVGAVYARQVALQGVAEVESGVRATVDAEQWIAETTPELTADLLIDSESAPYVTSMVDYERSVAEFAADGSPLADLIVQDTWFRGSFAAAEVIVSLPDGGSRVEYRQTRFYRETPQGWLRAEPSPDLWGTALSHETEHIIWRYRGRDEAHVLEIASSIDKLYVQMMQDYGLEPGWGESRLTINVRVDYLPKNWSTDEDAAGPVTLLSPSVYLAPLELSNAEVLAQAATLALTRHAQAGFIVQPTSQSGSDSVRGNEIAHGLSSGIRLWQLWDSGQELSKWQDEATAWVHEAGAHADLEQASDRPAGYNALCAAHNTWMIKPIEVGIPIYCDRGDFDPFYHGAVLNAVQSMHLVGQPNSDGLPALSPVQTATGLATPFAMYTLVDYAVSEYGRERLPELVTALRQHADWGTLVRAVYGTSLEDFEAGWRDHVKGMTH